jgi:MtfA peptidase
MLGRQGFIHVRAILAILASPAWFPWLTIALVAIGTVGAAAWIRARRRARRRALRARPIPDPWRVILEKNVALYRRLPDPFRERLHGYVNEFVGTVNLEGAGGLEMDDEIRVTIAGQACMLLLGRQAPCYPRLASVVVYPRAYVGRKVGEVGGRPVQGEAVHLGESWGVGTVVLAWDHVRRGARDPRDGENVVLHEFAHQLDTEDGRADGAPVLDSAGAYLGWSRVLAAAFEDLQRRLEDDSQTVLDGYGATNPAEFFAVATEAFFERPRKLREHRPELYGVLQDYFRMDPGSWPQPGR